jgi:hypothetical protein
VKKLKLKLEELEVTSAEMLAPEHDQGTVYAHSEKTMTCSCEGFCLPWFSWYIDC